MTLYCGKLLNYNWSQNCNFASLPGTKLLTVAGPHSCRRAGSLFHSWAGALSSSSRVLGSTLSYSLFSGTHDVQVCLLIQKCMPLCCFVFICADSIKNITLLTINLEFSSITWAILNYATKDRVKSEKGNRANIGLVSGAKQIIVDIKFGFEPVFVLLGLLSRLNWVVLCCKVTWCADKNDRRDCCNGMTYISITW